MPPQQQDLSQTIREAAALQSERTQHQQAINYLTQAIIDAQALESLKIQDEEERAGELEEALAMAGTGPWRMPGADVKSKPVFMHEREELSLKAREVSPIAAQGAFGDTELALQNVEWRREINLTWLEFSRWGIQQIILISRLYYIKNPLIQRGINVAAHYVFGRGVKASSPDPDANEVLEEFFERNKKTLGQVGLTDLERRKYYDGNIFFVFFVDKTNSGLVTARTIDATEIMEIITNPDDTDDPWYYKRVWTHKDFNPADGQTQLTSKTEWYPALGFDPKYKPEKINNWKVNWDKPILHRQCGAVSKWHFGCPLVYAALDWAKAATKFLEACATVKRALAQIAMLFTSKGGQQALQGAKQQLSTTIGPNASLWDQNPTAVIGSIFASGPGTSLAAFKTSGAGGNPEEVRQFKLQVAMVFGIPESFFSDMNTSNLATATSLDRPTQLNFMEKQEVWREDLTTICKFVLNVSMKAPSGKLREALNRRKADMKEVQICEATRVLNNHGVMVYEAKTKAAKATHDHKIEVMVDFPTIIEADMPARVGAIVNAATLGNKGGQIVGIDEKVAVGMLYDELGYENKEQILEEQYPEKEYDPDRTQQDLTAPIPRIPQFAPGGKPQLKAKPDTASQMTEALRRLTRGLRVWEKHRTEVLQLVERNGNGDH